MKRAFTLVELLVVLVIITIISVSIAPVFFKKTRSGSVRSSEPAGPPTRSSPRAEHAEHTRFYVADGVTAADVAQTLSNGGFRVQWFDDKTAAISH